MLGDTGLGFTAVHPATHARRAKTTSGSNSWAITYMPWPREPTALLSGTRSETEPTAQRSTPGAQPRKSRSQTGLRCQLHHRRNRAVRRRSATPTSSAARTPTHRRNSSGRQGGDANVAPPRSAESASSRLRGDRVRSGRIDSETPVAGVTSSFSNSETAAYPLSPSRCLPPGNQFAPQNSYRRIPQ